jgi:hypothetical protein
MVKTSPRKARRPPFEQIHERNEASAAKACPDCQHFARPGLSAGYCSRRDDLPLAYARTTPCDGFLLIVGHLVAQGRPANEQKENEHGNH